MRQGGGPGDNARTIALFAWESHNMTRRPSVAELQDLWQLRSLMPQEDVLFTQTYLGDPIELLLLHPDGRDELVLLGTDVLNGQRIQTVVPHGTWMGARLKPGGEYGEYGNTMAPGFVPSDFEPPDTDALVERWPHRAELIRALTRT